jgi:hypothetical protein
VGDVNGDGRPDVLVVSADITGFSRIYVFPGNGDGSLGTRIPSPIGYNAGAVALADFDSDGIPDVAVQTWDALPVLYGRGDGSFGPANNYGDGLGSVQQALVANDFNGDGSPDLAVLNGSSGNVGILLNAVPRGGPPPHAGGRSPGDRRAMPELSPTPWPLPPGDPAAAVVAPAPVHQAPRTPAGRDAQLLLWKARLPLISEPPVREICAAVCDLGADGDVAREAEGFCEASGRGRRGGNSAPLPNNQGVTSWPG